MASKEVTKPIIGKISEAPEPEPKPGWIPVAGSFEGRKKPDGLGEHWQ